MTDRALRYRASSRPPPGSPMCAFCGSRRNVGAGHVNGHEEDCAQVNLIWTCRRCNVRCGLTLQQAGLGRRTRQFNPAASAGQGAHHGRSANAGQRVNPAEGARTLGQWLTAVTSMKGESDAMPVAAAVEMIRATPPEELSRFAHQIWSRIRKQYGPSGRPRLRCRAVLPTTSS